MNFTGKRIQDTYPKVIHIESGSLLFNSTGSQLVFIDVSSSYALSASYAPSTGAGGTTLTTGSTYPFTSSWSQTSSYSNYTPIERSIVLCNSYTPTTSGPDTGEIIIPHNFLNLPITY